MYGLDHDRISLSTDASGHVNLNIYESDYTLHTIAGTTDVSSGTFDIGIYIRAKGDGSDVATLYVNAVAEDTHTGLTLTFDYAAFRELGTAWLLGGFPVAPTWTKETLMGSLPAADGWTYDGTATEAAHAVVSGGKLYQQIVGSTDTCYWHIHPTFSNANGWAVEIKSKVLKASDITVEQEAGFVVIDNVNIIVVNFHTYYIEVSYDHTVTYQKFQIDMTKQEHVFYACGKGTDFYLYCDGKLIFDGTGLFTHADATGPGLYFGDSDATASSNAEAIYDYIKYYETAAVLPQFTSGSLSEAALWSGDMRYFLSMLYNSGTRYSAKKLCGISENYVKWVKQSVKQEAIASTPTTVSTTPVLLTDMERFIYGAKLKTILSSTMQSDTLMKQVRTCVFIDGKADKYYSAYLGTINLGADAAAAMTGLDRSLSDGLLFGLHKIEGRWSVDANIGSATEKTRLLTIEEVE